MADVLRERVRRTFAALLLSALLCASFPAVRMTSPVHDGKDNDIDPLHDKINTKGKSAHYRTVCFSMYAWKAERLLTNPVE